MIKVDKGNEENNTQITTKTFKRRENDIAIAKEGKKFFYFFLSQK